MAIGNSSAVMATRNSDIPSTPRYQEIPRAEPALLAGELEAGVRVAGLERNDHPGHERQLEHRRADTERFGTRPAQMPAAGRLHQPLQRQEDYYVEDREAHVQFPVRKVR